MLQHTPDHAFTGTDIAGETYDVFSWPLVQGIASNAMSIDFHFSDSLRTCQTADKNILRFKNKNR
ncbi:hypothetical protein SDC9_148676 [bioreactor metagenome]|uniref:Uncharacterized protein n=1 Tax=bioreactor metagenome TaxID=1076179 RepID=A0A645EI82_9ZZZZ